MKIGFTPKTKDDWRLLLRLAKLIRLSDRGMIHFIVWKLEEEMERRNVKLNEEEDAS